MLYFFLFLFVIFGLAATGVVAFYHKFDNPDRIIAALAIASVISIFAVAITGAIEHHEAFEKSWSSSCK